MTQQNMIPSTLPPDYLDNQDYYSVASDTAFIAWLDLNYGIRPVALIMADLRGTWILAMPNAEKMEKFKLFRESEYFKHHLMHRHYLKAIKEAQKAKGNDFCEKLPKSIDNEQKA
jgi:hypothetical protein